MRYLREFFPLAASAVLLVLPFHWGAFWPSAFIAFVPAFCCLENKNFSQVFKRFFLFGFVYYALLGYWLNYVNVLGFFILAIYLSIYFSLFAVLARSYLNFSKLRHTFYVAAFWVFLEYARGFLIGGFPWALLAYSQWKNLWFIQAADVVGAYGISFLVIWVNVVLYRCLRLVWEPSLKGTPWIPRASLLGTAPVACLICVLIVVLGYGAFQLKSREDFYRNDSPRAVLRVSVLQGNIPQDQKWDARIKNIIFEKYKRLTLMAAMEKSDLVVWPETSFPGFLEDEPVMAAQLRNLVRQSRTSVLVGAPTIGDLEKELHFYNSAILYNANGEESKRYHKAHLVPFGEYIPLESVLGFLRYLVPIGHFSAGGEPVIFSIVSQYSASRWPPGRGEASFSRSRIAAKFSVLICYEDIFPELVRERCRRGADFLVNITNDAWFGKTTAPYQHAQASIFRAVENRVPVVRSANTGLSCFISAEGRILSSVKTDGEEIMVSGGRVQDITLRKGRSLYTRMGDIFFWVVLMLLWMCYRDKEKSSGYFRI